MKNSMQVSLVVLDQNLEFEPKTILGSDVATMLRARGFAGVIAIFSAESLAKASELEQLSTIDIVIPKFTKPAEMAKTLRAAVTCKRNMA